MKTLTYKHFIHWKNKLLKFTSEYLYTFYLFSVCKLWNLAATSKDFQKLQSIELDYKVSSSDVERLSFTEFMNILKFVTPKLKHVTIHRHDQNFELDTSVIFGRFEYVVQFTKQQEDILMNVFATQAKKVELLHINSFRGATKQDWQKFFQVNRVTNFEFTGSFTGQHDNSEDFFRHYIHILPLTVEQVGVIFERKINDKKNLLLIQKVFIFISLFIFL